MPMKDRIGKLLDLAEHLASEKENLAQIIVDEVRKPITYARAEVDRAIALARVVARRAQSFSEERSEIEGQVRYHPRGIVAIVTPWNNPLAIPLGKLAPALVYGNAVIWKPSPRAPRVAHALMPLLARAGFEEGLVDIVEGDEKRARQLISSGVDAVAFSGSSRTGWSIIAQASLRLLPVQAELGGNNGAIVAEDADLPSAADAIAEGAFGFAGQRCTSNRRAIVLAGVYDAFLAALEQSASALPAGDPLQAETRVSPMISVEAARAIRALVSRARHAGYAVLQSAGTSGETEAAFHPPTIILCDDPRAFIVQEESFGPILVVQKARHLEHALELLNAVPQGLVAALFSHDTKTQAYFLSEARAGLLKLNASTVNAGVDLPFTGWKQSGYGAAEHGEANAEFFTRRQAVYGFAR
jgi:acyl-CoA reductase-like NAD-dependent aldehyde dehydrogenase